MKTISITLGVLFAAFLSHGQGALTVKGNYNLGAGTVYEHSASTANVTLPGTGSKKTWNYSKLDGGSSISTSFSANKNTAFSKNAIVSPLTEEFFTGSETFPTTMVYDVDTKGFFYAGTITPRYASPLAEVTYGIYLNYFESLGMDAGTAAAYAEYASIPDSLIIFDQASPITSHDNIIKNPTTKGSKWSTTYTKTIKFSLTLGFLGWDKVPCTEVSYTTVTNEVVGDGDLNMPKNKENDLDVLLIKRSVKTIDSIFITGYDNKNDPLNLFYAFEAPQGGITYENYSESFYSKKEWRPMLSFDFGNDNSFSTLAGITYLVNNKCGKYGESVQVVQMDPNGKTMENTAGGISVLANQDINSNPFTIYPNPAVSGSTINARFIKNEEGTWNLNVTNSAGQVVNTIPVNGTGIIVVPVALNAHNNGGLYMLNLITDKGNLLASSKFNIAK